MDYLEIIIYVYSLIVIPVCLFGWIFEKQGVCPHTVFFCMRVGRCSCFALATIVITIFTGAWVAQDYAQYVQYAEMVEMAVSCVALWYSVIHIRASFQQINAMWLLYRRVESYMFNNICEMDQERFEGMIEKIHTDELFQLVDPQYHTLFDSDIIRLAGELGFLERR